MALVTASLAPASTTLCQDIQASFYAFIDGSECVHWQRMGCKEGALKCWNLERIPDAKLSVRKKPEERI